MNFTNSYTVEDLKQSAKIIQQSFYGIPIQEKELNNDEKLDKYYKLLDLTDFMKTFADVNSQS